MKRKVVVVASEADGLRVRALVRWLRALLPAFALVVSAPDALGNELGEEDGDAIIVEADALPSGPLSLADTLVRAAGPVATSGAPPPAEGRRAPGS